MTNVVTQRSTGAADVDAAGESEGQPAGGRAGRATPVGPTPAGWVEPEPGSVAARLRPLIEGLLGGPPRFAVRAWDGSVFGPDDAPATLVLKRRRSLRWLVWSPGELGVARAYVVGDIDVEGDAGALLIAHPELHPPKLGQLPALVATALRLGALGPPPRLPAEEARVPRSARLHSRRRDAAAVSHHYDVGNDFYRLLLGPAMTYSCAYFSGDGLSLAEAQEAKHRLVGAKLGLRPGMALLDVGCGWGSMAITSAKQFGVRVVGVTLSQEQATEARRRVRFEGLEHLVDIRLTDYRDLKDGPFDAVSSIGMFEHVGAEQVDTYFDALGGLIRPGGRLLNHAISRPDPTASERVDPGSMMGRYIFPDAALLEVGNTVSAMARHGWEVRDVQSLREHYVRTLHAWAANLDDRWDEAVDLVGERRARIWRLYLIGCAVSFQLNHISVHQVLAVRPHPDGSSGMPPTRAGYAG